MRIYLTLALFAAVAMFTCVEGALAETNSYASRGQTSFAKSSDTELKKSSDVHSTRSSRRPNSNFLRQSGAQKPGVVNPGQVKIPVRDATTSPTRGKPMVDKAVLQTSGNLTAAPSAAGSVRAAVIERSHNYVPQLRDRVVLARIEGQKRVEAQPLYRPLVKQPSVVRNPARSIEAKSIWIEPRPKLPVMAKQPSVVGNLARSIETKHVWIEPQPFPPMVAKRRLVVGNPARSIEAKHVWVKPDCSEGACLAPSNNIFGVNEADCCDEWAGFSNCGGLKANPGHCGKKWMQGQDSCESARRCHGKRRHGKRCEK